MSQPADGWRIKFGRKIALLPLNESELECNAMNRPERVDKISAVASVPTRFQPLVLVSHLALRVNAPLQPSAVYFFVIQDQAAEMMQHKTVDVVYTTKICD